MDVDATRAAGPATDVGQGFLHSLYPAGQEPRLLAGLHATNWRSAVYGSVLDQSNSSRWNVAKSAGLQTTAILSDM